MSTPRIKKTTKIERLEWDVDKEINKLIREILQREAQLDVYKDMKNKIEIVKDDEKLR